MTRLVGCIGCGILVSPGPRCFTCRRAWEQAYDAARPAHHAVYRTSAWRKLSAEVRASASRCTWCLKPLPLRKRVADHVVPLAEAPDRALDRSNLTVSCIPCNTRRGRNAKLPDPDAPPTTTRPAADSVGARMASDIGGSSS